jgi:tRNA dimethylallyltransferase
MYSYNLITILGPTAVGKTKLAVKLAKEFNGEIISADSRQVYKGMNIGTGKDLRDYFVDDFQVPYHLVDIAVPIEEYNLFRFAQDFNNAFLDISKRNRIPFLVGGTGLYLNAVLSKYSLKVSPPDEEYHNYLNTFTLEELQNKLLDLNPNQHNTTNLLDKERVIRAIEIIVNWGNGFEMPEINPLVIGVDVSQKIVKEKITVRLKLRLESGMIDEVKQLIETGIGYDKLNYFGLEYRYISLYLQGELNYNDLFQKLNSAIHNFAKRQMTWFRKIEKKGIKIHWIEGADFEKASEIIKSEYFNAN